MIETKIGPNEEELIKALKIIRSGNNVPLSQRVQEFYDIVDTSVPARGFSWSINEETLSKVGRSLTDLVEVVEPFRGCVPWPSWPSKERINIENLRYEDVRNDLRLLSNPLRKIWQVGKIFGGFASTGVPPFIFDFNNNVPAIIVAMLPGMALMCYGYYKVVFDNPKPKGYTGAIKEFEKLYCYAQKADSIVLQNFGTRGL